MHFIKRTKMLASGCKGIVKLTPVLIKVLNSPQAFSKQWLFTVLGFSPGDGILDGIPATGSRGLVP